MSKRINELAFKYHSEIYDDGFNAGKQAQQAFNTKITLRDNFAGHAMQVLLVDATSMDNVASNAYDMADAMLKAREAEDGN